MNVKDRDALIATRYLEENKSAPDLALEFGLTVARIYQILTDKGIKRNDATRPRTKTEGTRAFSQVHVNIGLKLYQFRNFENSDTRDLAAVKLNWSIKKLALVEKGETQLTVNDLSQIAKYLDLTLSDLLSGCDDIGDGA